MLSQKKLKELLYYNEDTGFFVWKKDKFNLNKYKVANQGDIAGCIDNNGYTIIGINSKSYSAHRLVWLYKYGHFPKQEIDHINRIRNDNRLYNLRDVSHKTNMNNKSKPKKNNLDKIIKEEQSKKFIYKILNKFEKERQEKENKICKDNNRLLKEQSYWYQLWI